MKLKEQFEFINALERKYPVDQWKVYGVDVWPLVRGTLFNNLYLEDTKGKIHKKLPKKKFKLVEKLFRTFLCQFKAIIKDWKNNKLLKDSDILFLTHTTCRTSKKSSFFWDSYCGDFENYFHSEGLSTFALEWAPSDEYRTPRFRPTKYIQLQLTLFGKMYKFKKMEGKGCQLDFYEDFLTDLAQNNIHLDSITIVNIKRTVEVLTGQSNYFTKVLQKINPKLVMVVTYYDLGGYALIYAAKNLRIPVVDIQHGVQGDFHHAYGSWNKVSKTGYNIVPNGFWVWSDEEERTIKNSFGITQDLKIFIGGNLSLKAVIDSFEFSKKENCIDVLITLQPFVDCLTAVEALMERSDHNIRWWIRLHPGMMGELNDYIKKFEQFRNPNIFVKEASVSSLFDILSRMDIHITFHSSVIIDAATLGIPSISVSKDSELIYKKLIENNLLIVLENVQIDYKYIEQMARYGKRGADTTIDSEKALKSLGQLVKNKNMKELI